MMRPQFYCHFVDSFKLILRHHLFCGVLMHKCHYRELNNDSHYEVMRSEIVCGLVVGFRCSIRMSHTCCMCTVLPVNGA
jgi:hypothetical protein